MQDISDRLGRYLVDAAGGALVVAVVVVVAWLAYRLLVRVARTLVARAAAAPLPGEAELDVDRLATRRAERGRRLETLAAFALRLVRWFVVALVVIVAISAFLPSVWAAIGGLGVGLGVAIGGAIGFGAQQLVRDYLNGVLILGENPYSVGDVVAIAGVTGTVEEVSLRRTVIRDFDGTVINRVGEAFAADLAWAPRLLDAPTVLRVDPVVDPGIPILVSFRVRPGEQWAVGGELRRRVIDALVGDGIRLATSQRLQVDAPLPIPAADADGAESGADFT